MKEDLILNIQKSFVSFLFFILVLASLPYVAFSQKQTTLSLLQNKVWEVQFPSKKDFVSGIKFTPSLFIDFLIYKKEKHEIESQFFLSPRVTYSFDSEKVGKVQEGKFLILKSFPQTKLGKSYQKISVYEILELTKTDLKLKVLSNNSILPLKAK